MSNNELFADLFAYRYMLLDNLGYINENDEINDVNEIEYLIERKTINDLMSSVIDGRYKEQKTRILETIDKSKFIFEINLKQLFFFVENNKNGKSKSINTVTNINNIEPDRIINNIIKRRVNK